MTYIGDREVTSVAEWGQQSPQKTWFSAGNSDCKSGIAAAVVVHS